MTTISQILSWPLGYESGGFILAVKTAKKIWQVGEIWYQQALVMDDTGEMLADFKIGQRIPLHSGGQYRTIKVQVQAEEKHGKKLFVDQFAPIVDIGEPPDIMNYSANEPERIVKSKIKCWLVAACLQGGKEISYNEINGLVEYIIK